MEHIEKGWLVIALVLLEIATVILYEFMVRHLRKKIAEYEMERTRSRQRARQKNYAGQIKNKFKELIEEHNPQKPRLYVSASIDGVSIIEHQFVSRVVLSVNLDFTVGSDSAPMRTKFPSGHIEPYQDTTDELQRLIAEAEECLRGIVNKNHEGSPVQ